MEDFKRISLDEETMSGHAETTYGDDTTAGSEISVINRACAKESQRMCEGLKVEHDHLAFSSQKVTNEDGSTHTKLEFDYEIKSDD